MKVALPSGKLAVIFIGTNKYLEFFPSYFNSCIENLAPSSFVEKHFFVFSDGKVEGELPDNITFIPTEHKPWPAITLERFHTILNIEDRLKDFDWILFLDADMEVRQKVESSELFTAKDFIGVHHPCHYKTGTGTYERNPKSEACVTGDQINYYQGCLWGGKTSAVIPMMKTLKDRVDKDYENDIIAVWHDESHLNRFFIDNEDKLHALSPDYAFPECYPDYPFEQKIVHLAKDNKSYQQ